MHDISMKRGLSYMRVQLLLDKCIKVANAVHEDNWAAIKLGREFSSSCSVESGITQGCVLSLFILGVLTGFFLGSTAEATGD